LVPDKKKNHEEVPRESLNREGAGGKRGRCLAKTETKQKKDTKGTHPLGHRPKVRIKGHTFGGKREDVLIKGKKNGKSVNCP